MTQIETTLIEDIESNFKSITIKIEHYRKKLKNSQSHRETNKYVENLIQSQELLASLSSDIDKKLSELIRQYF